MGKKSEPESLRSGRLRCVAATNYALLLLPMAVIQLFIFRGTDADDGCDTQPPAAAPLDPNASAATGAPRAYAPSWADAGPAEGAPSAPAEDCPDGGESCTALRRYFGASGVITLAWIAVFAASHVGARAVGLDAWGRGVAEALPWGGLYVAHTGLLMYAVHYVMRATANCRYRTAAKVMTSLVGASWLAQLCIVPFWMIGQAEEGDPRARLWGSALMQKGSGIFMPANLPGGAFNPLARPADNDSKASSSALPTPELQRAGTDGGASVPGRPAAAEAEPNPVAAAAARVASACAAVRVTAVAAGSIEWRELRAGRSWPVLSRPHRDAPVTREVPSGCVLAVDVLGRKGPFLKVAGERGYVRQERSVGGVLEGWHLLDPAPAAAAAAAAPPPGEAAPAAAPGQAANPAPAPAPQQQQQAGRDDPPSPTMPSAGWYQRQRPAQLNVRAAPQRDAQRLWLINPGEKVKLDVVQCAPGGFIWGHVTGSDGQRGWCLVSDGSSDHLIRCAPPAESPPPPRAAAPGGDGAGLRVGEWVAARDGKPVADRRTSWRLRPEEAARVHEVDAVAGVRLADGSGRISEFQPADRFVRCQPPGPQAHAHSSPPPPVPAPPPDPPPAPQQPPPRDPGAAASPDSGEAVDPDGVLATAAPAGKTEGALPLHSPEHRPEPAEAQDHPLATAGPHNGAPRNWQELAPTADADAAADATEPPPWVQELGPDGERAVELGHQEVQALLVESGKGGRKKKKRSPSEPSQQQQRQGEGAARDSSQERPTPAQASEAARKAAAQLTPPQQSLGE
eukprot:TRINITY_DN13758_c0_g1_i1.p1 TRINITY_DN13758_c0_g1~~TRINITY_DN13758_c0_g1_i1.p1  ORF type:complete len:845 (+),score=219.32 TRINITY_DN13758_c0_g1_i1:156-2537(+)